MGRLRTEKKVFVSEMICNMKWGGQADARKEEKVLGKRKRWVYRQMPEKKGSFTIIQGRVKISSP